MNPQYTALLLIDIQNDYCSPGGHADKMGTDMSMLQQVPARVKPVLAAAFQFKAKMSNDVIDKLSVESYYHGGGNCHEEENWINWVWCYRELPLP